MSQPKPMAARQTGGAPEGQDARPPERVAIAAEPLIADFPGPALLVGPDGQLLAHNLQAEALLAAFSDPHGALAAAARAAASTRTPGQERVHLPAEFGGAVLDLSLLPCETDHVAVLGRDATLETNLTGALVASRQLFKDLVACSSNFAWETDATGAFTYVSPRGALGFTPQELFGRAARSFIADRDPAPAEFPFEARQPLDGVETWLSAKDGTWTCLIVSCLPVFDADDRWTGVRGVCHDATLERGQQAALERAANRAELERRIIDSIRNEIEPERMLLVAVEATMTAVETGQTFILRAGADGRLEPAAEASPDGAELPEELWRQADTALRASTNAVAIVELEASGRRLLAARSEHRARLKGGICVTRGLGQAAWSDDERALVASVAAHLGIAIAQIENYQALERLSRTDDLTGLLNRRAFVEELPRRLTHQRRKQRVGALLYIDLDNFKTINDQLGHQHGDEMLRRFGRILRERSRVGDLAVRLGGDEFALWLEETELDGAKTKAAKLLAAADELSELTNDRAGAVSLSIGIALSNPTAAEPIEALIGRADGAMYQAKRGGKNQMVVARLAPEPSGPASAPADPAKSINPGAK